ncbi:MAG: hypothetical protein AAF385_10755 [Pseudomonadota bacterium]
MRKTPVFEIVSALAVATLLAWAAPVIAEDEEKPRVLKVCERHYAKAVNSHNGRPKALKSCIRAARAGHTSAFVAIGVLYREGIPTMGTISPVRYPELAYKSFKEAAERGSAQGHYLLGVAYERGEGVVKDLVAAAVWKAKAETMGYVHDPDTHP